MPAKNPTRRSVEMAKLAVFWDDEAPNKLVKLFPHSNDPSGFYGTREQLEEMRDSMKKYEETEAAMGEDREFYNARFELQFVEADE